MSGDDTGESGKPFHYESGIPVFDKHEARLIEVERKAAAAEARDEEYKDRQVKINFWIMIFTGFLVLGSLVTGGISIWQARIANRSANAAKDAADAAKKSADTAEHSFQMEKRRAEDMEQAILMISSGPAALKNAYPIYLGNSGKVTARNVEAHLDVFLAALPRNKEIRSLDTFDASSPQLEKEKNLRQTLDLRLTAAEWDSIADTKKAIVESGYLRYENGFERTITENVCNVWIFYRTPEDKLNPIQGRGSICQRLPELLANVPK